MIDSHCHLFFDSLRNNFSEVIKRSIDNNITAILSINTNINEFEEHYNLINNYKSIFISFGQHPEYVNDKNIVSTNDIISVSKNNNVIGIGETGIDLYHSTEHIKSQYKSFENHIEACLSTGLPLIIHQRNSENEIITTLGSKEGLANLASAITSNGDQVIVPNPSYPIHPYGFIIAGASVQAIDSTPDENFIKNLHNILSSSKFLISLLYSFIFFSFFIIFFCTFLTFECRDL